MPKGTWTEVRSHTTTMEYLSGLGIALAVAAFASRVGLDKDRAFYPVVLIVIASYYVLFAAMGASIAALAAEAIPVAAFVAVAIVGFKRNPWLLVMGLAAHGLFDFLHPMLIQNPGVPVWWPGFCLAYDFAAAASLALRLRVRRVSDVA